MAFKEFSGELDATPGLKEFSGELDKPDEGFYKKSVKAIFSKIVPNGNDLRDLAAATLKIGPTALKGVGDITQLVTGGKYGSGVSNAMAEGMQAIDSVIGTPELAAHKANVNAVLNDPNKGIADLASTVIENPRAAVDAGVSTVGSMFVPAGAAKAVTLIPKLANSGKAATAAAVGSNAVMNAADTFTSIDSPDLADKYTGAGISGLASLGVGALTGGGAEGVIAKKIANDPSFRATAGNVFAKLFGTPVKTMAKEGLQESGEASGNYVGEVAGGNGEFDINQLGKRAAYEGALGAILGGGVGMAANTGGRPDNRPSPIQTIEIIGNPGQPKATGNTAPESAPTAAPAAPVAPAVNAEAVANLAALIEQTATQDSKLNLPVEPKLVEAPADIQLDPAPEVTPQAPEVSAVATVATQAAPVVTALPQEAAHTVSPSDAALSAVIDPMPQADPVVATMDNAASTNEPAKIDTGRFMQLTEPQAGFRPGDIVGVGGKALKHKINAQRAAKDAGQGWRVVRAGQGFVVRYQPASEKQIANGQAMAKRQRSVDTDNDSLFAAIAKMGGINMDSVMKQWGYDKASVSKLFGAGIRRVVTKNGMSIDEIGQQLAEYGYLSMDEHGKHDTSELESYFAEELGGSKHFTPEGYVNDARKNEPEYNDLTEQDVSESGLSDATQRNEDFISSLEADDDYVFDAESAFSLSLEENYDRIFDEETDRLNESLSQAAEDNRLSADNTEGGGLATGNGDAQAGRGTEAQPRGTGSAGSAVQQDPANYGLESYTNRDIIERLDRIERTQKEQAAANTATDTKAKADAEADTFALTGSNRQADVQAAQGQGSLFQPAAEYKTDPSIQADVERAYGGRKAYEKAKASGATELTYDQWLRIRLPAFKRAFGNWEAVSAQKKLDAMAPIEVRVPDEWRSLSYIELRQKMAEALDRMVREKVSISHPDIGVIKVSRAGVTKSVNSSRDPAKSIVSADIDSIIPASIYARSDPSRGGDNKEVDGYSTLLANVSIDGVPLVAVFTVRHQTDGIWYYNSVVLHDTKEKAQSDTPKVEPDRRSFGGSRTSTVAGLSEFIRKPLMRVNPDSLKGAVNPRTGEPENPESFTIPANEYTDTYARQRDFFLDYGPDESQAGAAGEAAQREAVSAMDDLRSSGSVLGKALSSEYATGQRVTLVGQRVDSAEDLATLAQVYRDPRFETFRLIFTNDAGRVVSQIGLTSRLPASTQAIMGDDADAYLKDVSAVAKARGATRYWMLHNHPSGLATPSSADINLTRYFTEKIPGLSNDGHVVIDTNEYSYIDPFATGQYDVRKKDFGAVTPMTAGEFTGIQITSADKVMEIAKRLDVDHGAVTLIAVSAQMKVLRISTIPSSAVSESDATNHRTMLKEALAGKGMFMFVVGRDMKTLEKIGKFAMDGVHIANDGSVTTLNLQGKGGELDLLPDSRKTRLSPDSSPEFDYLRGANQATQAMIARQGAIGSQYTDGLQEESSANRSFDAADLLRIRRDAAAIESPERGITFQITEDRKAIVRGPAGTRVPDRFAAFAEKEGLTLSVRRNQNGKGDTRPMPIEYRESGALYFGEGFDEELKPGFSTFVDRTGKSAFQDIAEYDNQQLEMNAPESKLVFAPLKLSDFWSTVKGESGRKQYAAGRKLWDSLDYYAKEYLVKLKLADTKPGAFKEMLRQFNVDKTKASQQAKRIAETGMSLTPEQRELLSDLVEKQAKVGDMVPEDVSKLATTMTAALDVQARDLVELGMLSEDRLVKNYLPRLYKNGLSGMLTNPTLMRSWFTKARMKIRGDRLMSRGMFEEIDANKVEQAKRLGWKVSSMPGGDPVPGDLLAAIDSGSDIPGQYRSAKVLMWRDYTESERQQMGEIRDGVLRYALGYVETQKDIAIGRLFKAIANNSDLAKAYNPGGWVKVPDQEIKGAPGTKAYGALAGMWVEPQVADSLKRNTQPKGVLMAAYDKALSFWKEGKTVWNPVSHGNNVVSNLFTIYFAGINPANPKPWRETLREYRTKGEYYTEALDNGLFGNEWANKEIQDLLMPDFADMADMETVAASRVAKMVKFAKKTGKPVSWYRENMQKAYEFEDQFFKLMLYIDRRKAGMEPHAAITDAERYVFNYADMPEGVELIKRTLSPFFAYTYKAIPMVLHTAMTRPDRMLAPIMLLGGANWLAYMLLGADEEEERKGMPEYMKGRTAIGTQKSVRMPFNIGGQPAFLDMSRRVPLGDLFDINNQTGGLPIPAPMMPSHPLLAATVAVLYNQDTYTGKDLVKKSDTGWEAAQARAGYLTQQFTPNAPFIPGSYNFNKLADSMAYAFDTEIGPYTGYTKGGDPIRMGTVLPDVLTGTKIRSFDVDKQMAYKNADLNKEAQEIRANIRAAMKNKAMSESSRERYVESQQEKLQRLGERRVELNQ